MYPVSGTPTKIASNLLQPALPRASQHSTTTAALAATSGDERIFFDKLLLDGRATALHRTAPCRRLAGLQLGAVASHSATAMAQCEKPGTAMAERRISARGVSYFSRPDLGAVAQRIERWPPKPQVAGSKPACLTPPNLCRRLAGYKGKRISKRKKTQSNRIAVGLEKGQPTVFSSPSRKKGLFNEWQRPKAAQPVANYAPQERRGDGRDAPMYSLQGHRCDCVFSAACCRLYSRILALSRLVALMTDSIRIAFTAGHLPDCRPPYVMQHVPELDAMVSRPVGVGGTHQYNDVRRVSYFRCANCGYVKACDSRPKWGKTPMQAIGITPVKKQKRNTPAG